MDVSAIMAPLLTAKDAVSKKGQSNLSTTDFYKLLAAQIQYQNPFDGDSGGSSSGGSEGYLTDLAIMSATTAIQEMTKVENYTMSSAMAGKKVSFNSLSTSSTGEVTTTKKNGKVTAVDFTAEKPRLYVTSDDNGTTTGEWVQYNAITGIYSDDVTFGTQSSATEV